MHPYVIRRPREDEGSAVGQLQNRAWEQAYSGLLPARFWNAEALSQREAMWTRGFSLDTGRAQVRVAEHQDAAGQRQLIGFAAKGPVQDDDVAVSTQLYTCYVLAEHHGTGAASQLITDLLGAESASLWVFEGNPRACRFYEKHGFTADGKSCDLGEAEQDEEIRGIKEIRMVRAEPGRAPVQ